MSAIIPIVAGNPRYNLVSTTKIRSTMSIKKWINKTFSPKSREAENETGYITLQEMDEDVSRYTGGDMYRETQDVNDTLEEETEEGVHGI